MQCDKLTPFNWNSIYNSINNGCLVEANAEGLKNKVDEVSHSWIIDGYMIANFNFESYKEQAFYVHNNWGWNGSYDGYFLLEDAGIKFDLPGVKLDRLLNIHANIKKK